MVNYSEKELSNELYWRFDKICDDLKELILFVSEDNLIMAESKAMRLKDQLDDIIYEFKRELKIRENPKDLNIRDS